MELKKMVAIPLSRKRKPHTYSHKSTFIAVVLLIVTGTTLAQTEESHIRLGLNLGLSRQDVFPYKNENYTHQTKYLKIQVSKKVWSKHKQSLEVLLEPSVYLVEHQLVNLFFIKPSKPDFQSLRERFTQKQSYEEYALNIGLQYNYQLYDQWLVYGLISLGPMTATQPTERQAKGFSFSDIIGLGTRYKIGRLNWDLRFTLRHVSNANLKSPNEGHNSAGIESGFSYNL